MTAFVGTALRGARPGDGARVEDVAPDTLVVHGGAGLRGSVRVGGFKHALVSCVALAAAVDGPVRLRHVPEIEETRVLSGLLARLGARVERSGDTLTVDCGGLADVALPEEDVARIHGSVYLVPALLGRFGRVRVAAAGGCRIGAAPGGARPVAQYVEVLRRFGARQVGDARGGGLTLEADRLTGCEIDLTEFMTDTETRTGPLYSGATKYALLTAAVATGDTVVRAPYPKPDVTELVAFMRAVGVPVVVGRDGSYRVTGRGGAVRCAGAEHELVPDLIEIVTWICAGALTAAEPLTMRAPRMDAARAALAPELAVVEGSGVRVDWHRDRCTVHPAGRLRPVAVTAASHGVFSDSQPLLALLGTRARGVSTVVDTVWPDRFGYAAGLRALGIDVRTRSGRLELRGPWHPAGAERVDVDAADLRAAASLLLAAVQSPHHVRLTGAAHLARGYADLPGALAGLGARITSEEPR